MSVTRLSTRILALAVKDASCLDTSLIYMKIINMSSKVGYVIEEEIAI